MLAQQLSSTVNLETMHNCSTDARNPFRLFRQFRFASHHEKNCTDQHNFILVAKTSLLARDVLQCEHQTRRVTSVFDFSGSNSRLWLVTLTRSRKHETAMHMCLDTEPGANTGRAKKFRSKLLGSLLGDDWSSMQSTAIYVDVVWCSEQAILLVFQLLWLTRQGNALRYWLLPLRLSVRHLQALFGEVPATALSAVCWQAVPWLGLRSKVRRGWQRGRAGPWSLFLLSF